MRGVEAGAIMIFSHRIGWMNFLRSVTLIRRTNRTKRRCSLDFGSLLGVRTPPVVVMWGYLRQKPVSRPLSDEVAVRARVQGPRSDHCELSRVLSGPSQMFTKWQSFGHP